jgi:hypothetical protein
MEKFDPNRSLTPSEFRYFERMSPSKYHELKKKGLGPEETDIDGMKRITPQSRERWHQLMAERARSETALLETERRRAQTVEAGKIAAASPLHVSKRGAAHKQPARGKRG